MQKLYKNGDVKDFIPAVKTFAVLFFTLILSASAFANTYNVTDVNDGHAVNQLRGAIEAADAAGGTHTINVAAGNYILTLGQITFGNSNQNITIIGAGAATTFITMTGPVASRDRIFFINPSGTTNSPVISVSGITFQGGYLNSDPYGGAAICAGGGSAESLTITNCAFDNNVLPANAYGGAAICMQVRGNLTIDNSTFTNNVSNDADGGAVLFIIFSSALGTGYGTLNVTNSTFTGNSVVFPGAGTANGGALAFTGQAGSTPFNATITNNTFINNTADGLGGGLSANNSPNVSTPQIHFNRFVGNTATTNAATSGMLFVNSAGSVNAENNWWGCNTNPAAGSPCDGANGIGAPGAGTFDANPWLQLRTTASPSTICNTTAGLGNTTTVTTSFLNNSDGTAIPVANLSRLIGLPVTWGPTTLGTLSAQQTTIQASGTATATFTSNGTGGTATVNTEVDNVPAGETTPARANITVHTIPIVTDPANTTVCAGSTATFTSTVTGTPTPTIQWYKGATPLANVAPYSGVNTAILTITNAQLGDASADYNVKATNECGTDISANATLIVNIPSVAPTSISGTTIFCNPGSTTLTAEGGTLGTGANYQWGTGAVVGTSPLTGQTASTLTVSPTSTTTYWVRIENTTAPCPPNTSGVTQVVTVNQPSVAPTSITGTTTICNGSPTTLTAVGGTLGTGANYQWGTGAVLGTSPLAGQTASTLTVSPTSTTTYWVRIENTTAPCTANTSGVTQVVTVNQPSVAPTSISGTTNYCNPGSTTLTAVGGTLGTGANYQWGTGAVVGTSPLTGETASTLTVSPTSTTTYWVRIENTTAPCTANTSGVTQVVTVNQPSVAPTGATGTKNICTGGGTTLTVAGGSKGTGATTEWFTGSCGGTPAGTGDAITVSPITTTTYFVRYNGTCNTTTCATVTVTIISNNTINLTSAAGTDDQTACVNTAITNITYATTGATGANFSGLPAGVTGSWLADVVTISGIPSAQGPFSYTVTLTGGCGNATATGSITVNPVPTINTPDVIQPTCEQGGTIVVNATGSPTMQYSIDGGDNWFPTSTFSGLAYGDYNIAVRSSAYPDCIANYSGNPVVLNAATGCCIAPTVDQVPNQIVCNNSSTAAVNFTGTAGATFNWTNNASSIGLATNGTGNIASFTALNATNAPVTATITVTPSIPPPNLLPAGWSYSKPFTVTENSGSALSNYQLRMVINTQSLIASGSLDPTGKDLRFGYSNGTFFNYWIESGLNTATTIVWVKLDGLPASGSKTFFMYYGNPAASAVSAITGTFAGPNSSTDSVASGDPGGVGNSQRGFRFSPNEDVLVTSFGKREPTGSTRYITLFDFATQAILRQTQVSGPAGQYSYTDIASPTWLTQNTQYLLEIYQDASDGYYFGASSQIGEHLTYYDMKYCNGCTQNTYPTNTLTNYHYGYPDLWYYTKNNASPAPTYVEGVVECMGTPKTFTITVNPTPIVSTPGVTQPTCATPTGTIVVNATGSGTLEYSIDGGSHWSTSNTFAGKTAGSYYIAVRSQSYPACIVNYSNNPVVLIAATGCTSCSISTPDAQICAGSTTSHTSSITPAGGTITHSWLISGNGTINGSTTGSFVIVAAGVSGSYTLTDNFTQNGIPGSCTKIFTINAVPTCSISGDDPVCANSTHTYSSLVTPSDGAITHYWTVSGNATISGVNTNASVTIIAGASGTYTIKDNITRNGCPSSCNKTVTIFVPACNITGLASVNANTTNTYNSTGSEAGATLSWSISGNASISGATNGSTVNVLAGASGSFILTLSVTKNGCTSICTKTVTITSCTITCPANITVNNKTGSCGNYVSYPAATKTGNCGNSPLTYSQASGSWFPVGITTVNVSSSSGASCSFTITVNDVQKPVITCPANIVVTPPNNACSKVVNYTVTATDNCPGVIITAIPASGSVFNAGTTTVNVTATDASGNISTSSFTITVNDTKAPVITCPPAITVNAEAGICKALVDPGTATAIDNCSVVTITGTRSDGKALNAYYPLGTTTITWKAKDASGNTATCTQKIIVKDNQPPLITNVNANPNLLWPADHTMKTVNINYDASDNCGPADNCAAVSCQLSVTSNEPVSGTGNGDLSPDWEIVNNKKVKLRAERKNNGTGRIYTVTITCKDGNGNTSVQTTTVTVPLTNASNKGSENNIPAKPTIEFTDKLTVQVMPNPSGHLFNLLVKGSMDKAIEIRILDMAGRQIKQMRTSVGTVVRFGEDLMQGTYIVEVRQGNEKEIVKVIKL